MENLAEPIDYRYEIQECLNRRKQLTQMANLILDFDHIDTNRLKVLAQQYRNIVRQENHYRMQIRMRAAGPLPLWVERYAY